jgi:alkylation response protein AidB-like acyl-CoA dehydrogenase
MDLRDAPDEARFRAELRAWLAAHAAQAARVGTELDAGVVAAWRAWSRRLYDAGYAGLTWPQEHGGRGLPVPFQAIWLEESARAGVPDHIGIIGLGMAGPTIMRWGDAPQRERYLAPILRADEIWCQGFSEPESGSDLASVRTRAVRDGDAWVVNGQKVWSSFAHLADWCILLVRTDPDVPAHAGLSYLLLDMRAPGVEVCALPQLTGDPEFNEIFLTDVRVPATAMLGRPGDGWKVAMTTLSHERGTHGVGLAAAFDAELRRLTALMRETGAAGDPLLRDRLAELWVELQALRITNLRSLSEIARRGAPGPEATISKLHWSELNQRLTELALDVLGPSGLEQGPHAVDEGRWAFARLRARGNTIEAGTSEILRNIIAERVVGLPRSR